MLAKARINSRGFLKFLKAVHLVTSAVWLGGVACITALTWVCFFHLDETGFLTVAALVPELYLKVIMPAAALTVAQGLAYGAFTNWGFFGQGWIRLKWLSVPLVIACTGVGSIGQMFSAIQSVQENGFNGGLADGGLVLLFMAVQLAILTSAFIISVLRPGKKPHRPNNPLPGC
jgi:uncharacterized membrane protein